MKSSTKKQEINFPDKLSAYLVLVWFKNNMKLTLILHKYIQQAILSKPLGIQNSTRIFQYAFSTTFQYYPSCISVK